MKPERMGDWDTLDQMLVSRIAVHASRPALWVDDHLYTYQELAARAYGIANALTPLATRRTVVFANRSLWSYAGIVGILLAGHTYVPLNPGHPVERLSNIIESADVGALVIDYASLLENRPLISRMPPMTIIVPDGGRPESWTDSLHRFIGYEMLPSSPPPTPTVEPGDGAYLLFTSGSTGQPKGVLVTHANVMAYLATACQRYDLTPHDRTTQLFDLTFDLSVHDLFVTWEAGAALYCPPHKARSLPYQFIRAHQITSWFSTPATIALMSRLGMLKGNVFPSLRWSLFCGEALPKSVVEQWMIAAPNSIVENLYGPTEATIAITVFRLPQYLSGLPDIIPIGSAFSGQHAVIVNGQEEGELMLGGSQVTPGYWRRPDLTEARFSNTNGIQWYATGDRAKVTEHGLCFLGRLDRQVKIQGNRVDLLEVETTLRRASACDSVAAVPWPIVNGLAQGIVGFVATDFPSDEVILWACRQSLPAYMIPSKLIHTPNWPLNSNGKTDYHALAATLTSEC